MKFKSIKGTKDILPGEVDNWQHVELVIHRVMRIFNYHEIRTPVFESTALFSRSMGELSDIVSKEMYTFLDRSEESVTLKPEGTASVLRAYLQNNLADQSSLTKLYYIGPMFRQERPQAGRLRQFHQFGAEVLGSTAPELDVEMMLMALDVYKTVGITDFNLKVNSVGCPNCRPRYKDLLVKELTKVYEKLSPESQARMKQNPLRILDSKDANDRKLTSGVPPMKDHLCEECKNHFASVLSFLNNLHLQFEIDGRLVRGLDYYTKTAFEITSGSLGSQDALAGGGRYDLLVEELGGKPTPGVGFAAGMERLMMVLEKNGISFLQREGPSLFLIALDDESRQWAFLTASSLRSKGIPVELDYLRRSVKAQMREADRQNARFVIVVGSEELKSRSAKLKEMKSGKETPISLDGIEVSLR